MFYRQIWFGDWKSISSPNRIPDWHACMETLPCDSFAMNIDFTRMTKCILLEKQQLFQPPTFPDSDLAGGNHQGWLLSFRLSLLPPQARWTIYRTHRPIPSIPSWKNLKVILHGEHAVVYGMTAVGASLDLRTSITIKPHPSKVSLSQWLSPWHLPVTIVHHFQKQNQLSICQVVVHFPDLGLSDSWTIVQLKELFRCFWKFLTWSQSKSWMNLFQALPKIPEQCVPRLSEPSSWFPWSRPVQS